MTDLQFKLLLTAVAFGTSIVSGVLGMAGGLILLSALLLKLDPVIAVPVHGLVQLVSNGSRCCSGWAASISQPMRSGRWGCASRRCSARPSAPAF